MKKYEIALLFGSYEYESVKTYEYDTIKDMQQDLKKITENADTNLYKIELSIQEQDLHGENLNTYTFCEIDMQQLRQEAANK